MHSFADMTVEFTDWFLLRVMQHLYTEKIQKNSVQENDKNNTYDCKQ